MEPDPSNALMRLLETLEDLLYNVTLFVFRAAAAEETMQRVKNYVRGQVDWSET